MHHVQQASLPRTFMAVLLDTPVASGSIHSPFKQPAGDHLARGALDAAYGIPQPSVFAGDATLSEDKTQVVIPIEGLMASDTVALRGSRLGGGGQGQSR
jgi:hypothetical protein